MARAVGRRFVSLKGYLQVGAVFEASQQIEAVDVPHFAARSGVVFAIEVYMRGVIYHKRFPIRGVLTD